MFWTLLLLLLLLVCFSFSTKLEVFDLDNSNATYFVNAPPFSLGSLNFPVSGLGLWVESCDSFPHIKDEDVYKISNNSMFIILAPGANRHCFQQNYAFECQKRKWCAGILREEIFYAPAGLHAWSMFNEYIPRSQFKVPFVYVSTSDFNLFYDQVKSKPTEHLITLTLDLNEWETMLTSIGFKSYFQGISTIWSFCCLVLCIHILTKGERKRKQSRITIRSRFTLRKVCVSLHAATHIARVIFYSVDPYFSTRTLLYQIEHFLLGLTISFEVVTNILMSFLVRELTNANKTINALEHLKWGYCVSLIFFAVDFMIIMSQSLSLSYADRMEAVKAIFYLITNVGLGSWYIYQGYRFFKRSINIEKSLKKANHQREILTRIAMCSAGGMIFFSGSLVLILLPSVFGTPWGYYATWVTILFIIQLSSFTEILLFGGIALEMKTFSRPIKRILFRYESHSETIAL